MLHAVLGHGRTGRLHRAWIEAMGDAAISVDPASSRAADHPSLRAIPPEELARIGLWHVCTPAWRHLSNVESILARDPAARILCAAPLCRTGEAPRLAHLLALHPRARLVVMDPYAHAAPLHWLARMRERIAAAGEPVTIETELTKNREADAATGRHVDRDWGVFGYEWTHLLAIAGLLLTAEDAADLALPPAPGQLRLGSVAENLPQSAMLRMTLRSGTEVALAAAVDGRLLLPHPVALFDTGFSVSRFPLRRIGRGDDTRYRFARVATASAEALVVFEPATIALGAERNAHLCVLEEGGERREFLVESNHHERCLRDAVAMLLDADPMPAAEHLAAALRRQATIEAHAAAGREIIARDGALGLSHVGARAA